MDNSEQMIMKLRLLFCLKGEQPYYKYFTMKLLMIKVWDRALLKRKEKIQRTELYKMPNTPKNFKGNGEFF